MNIAFPVLILTLALLPGFLFRYAMLRGTFRRSPVTAQQVAGDLGWLTLVSALLHTAVGTLFHAVHFAPSFGVVLALLIGNFGKDSYLLDAAIEDLTTRPWPYLAYFAAVCAVGHLLGRLAHAVMRRRAPTINDWHDLLDAAANAATFDGVRLTPDVYVTAVVDMKLKDQPVLIRGLVDDWLLTPTGELDSIILTRTFRRPLPSDRPAGDAPSDELDARYYQIRGDYFILRRSEMITLNIQYLYTAPRQDVAADETLPAPTTTLPPGVA